MSAGIFGLRANESIGGTGYLEGIILPYVVTIAFPQALAQRGFEYPTMALIG